MELELWKLCFTKFWSKKVKSEMKLDILQTQPAFQIILMSSCSFHACLFYTERYPFAQNLNPNWIRLFSLIN